MSAPVTPRRRALVLAAVPVAALSAWWATGSGSEAAPSSNGAAAPTSQAGKISFDSLPGAVKATLPLRSFTAGGTNTSTPVGSGGGTGKFVADDTTAVVDAADVDPLLLRAVTTGVHLQTVTVTLFRPGTAERQEVWVFGNSTLSKVGTAQSGSARSPRVALGLRYARVTVTSYDTKGAVAGSYCFALDTSTSC